ncbi:MAG: hypothetical protein OEL66_04865 [Desulfobulbaceae bacterium]|nr:hypothetical protein [Desulfobulbaceae bacterium]
MGDDSQQKDALPDNLDDDLASDWESAFKADDFSFSPEDGEDDFFLGDETDFTSATSSPYDFTPPSEKELEDLPDLDEDAFDPDIDDSETTSVSDDSTQQITPGDLPARLLSLYHTAILRLQLLPRKQQIIAGVAVACLLLLPMFLPDSGDQEEIPAPISQTETAATEPSVSPDIAGGEEQPQEEEIHEKVRVKWKFPSFLIPAPLRQDTPRKSNFVQTDITLILLLDEGQEPPSDKELLVREIIFQFYSNQPLSELRRFALARGDMNRALRAWLEKQWPQAPVEAIVFNRYHII